ncbi:hypothetical protein MJH54_33255, partial [Salmonella enterica subsp. enterica serovar Montevideo]|nr:hypothetical protein [Salmonella enterica subsp. enterica serovar Montevideo]
EIGQAVVDLRQDMAGNRQDVIPVYGDPDIGSWVTDVLDLDAMLVLGYFQVVWPLNRQPVPLPKEMSQWPTVDIFVPTYNEDLNV